MNTITQHKALINTLHIAGFLIEIRVAGVDGLLLSFFNTHIENSQQRCGSDVINTISTGLKAADPHFVVNFGAYHQILLTFDVMILDHLQCVERLAACLSLVLPGVNTHQLINAEPINDKDNEQSKSHDSVLTIPVYYDNEVAADLLAISQKLQLSVEQIIELHCAPTYHVEAIGFAPGFGYLAELPSPLQLPRKATPVTNVAAGSVAIAGNKTAIYPQSSPAGWHVIGRTPVTLFDPTTAPYSLLSLGLAVQFNAISRHTFLELGGQLD
ncbi:5-oxoprolinase subunit B family protein [Flocculibacter collagenilyticus]|uniref:5-oxoprolinase subunit B family protein n=1 Tax=Flocculibacter collagenilyticus TaxID=2744479 RepID=UPI0018F28B54|nr:allophanate hydrolase subunit 1 [Flocculibacter collagenilyticus]